MWNNNWRDLIWQNLDQHWDIIIVGGGITGAGLLREATQRGLRCLLAEATDFSFGTSSRSSKLIHGGFRYLANRQFSVTRESVHEREWLLKEAKPLVLPLEHIMPLYKSVYMRQIGLGLTIYDIFGEKWAHRSLSPEKLLTFFPGINPTNLVGGYEYYDAQVDDSRLVLRIIREAVRQGAVAINYASAKHLIRDSHGQVCGVHLVDTAGLVKREVDVMANVVINASGPWTDILRADLGAEKKVRKLRGSHLIFSKEILPVKCAISLSHPKDHRGMFLLPWEGASMIGTTDVDHDPLLEDGGAEPFASQQEIDYIMEALYATLPDVKVTQKDIMSTFSGLRPVVFDGDVSPSKASRKHVILVEEGLLTITGGKLTILRLMADETLKTAAKWLPNNQEAKKFPRFFDPIPVQEVLCESKLSNVNCLRLLGRYGTEAGTIIRNSSPEDLTTIGESNILWAELKFAALDEGVVHLDDLQLRRGRLGLLSQEGGLPLMDKIRKAVIPILG